MSNKAWLLAAAGLALAIPALAQQVQTPATPSPAPSNAVDNSVAPVTTQPEPAASGPGESAVEVVSNVEVSPPPPAVEYPSWARRDPAFNGLLDPADVGLGSVPWGAANGAFLSTLMRRMDTPIASRWAHIALRNALLTKGPTPRLVNPVDWIAERAWLLLRMGEADAARLLVAGVDTDRFTPKMVQVAVQSALADADPPALCPLEEAMRKYEPGVRPMVTAMCSSLSGEPQIASAQIDDARRYGRIGGIDLVLAEKVVGAGSNTGRSTTIEWEPVTELNAWRFGLATATGLSLPDRLMIKASPQLRAFQARAALLEPEARLESAFIATGLGVFSSQSMVDLYSAIYDSTDPGDLGESDAWKLRQAFVGKDDEAKLGAIRHFLAMGGDPLKKEGARAVVARAASFITPNADFEQDAPGLISAMLAAGYDRAAARWLRVVDDMSDDNADRCWAMLALAAPDGIVAGVSTSRINSFIGRDKSLGKQRSALLVAGLAGLGRISESQGNSINRRHGLGLGRTTGWSRMIDAAAARRQPATVLVLTGTGFQASDWKRLSAAHLFHAIAGLKRTGQDYSGRMIAAEALSRT
ncbi:MAG: hypothetical protein H0W71_05835 [Sphingomonas sp.]|nr:hypothetical protein [Sphingomonas sp.]